jgi:hypothetical protein
MADSIVPHVRDVRMKKRFSADHIFISHFPIYVYASEILTLHIFILTLWIFHPPFI